MSAISSYELNQLHRSMVARNVDWTWYESRDGADIITLDEVKRLLGLDEEFEDSFEVVNTTDEIAGESLLLMQLDSVR